MSNIYCCLKAIVSLKNTFQSIGVKWITFMKTICACHIMFTCFTALHGPTVQQVRGNFSKQCSLCSAEDKILNTGNGMYDGHVFTMHHLSCENLTYHGNIDVF